MATATRFRDQLRTGREAIQAARDSVGGGSFTPVHRFESGETKYLQFVDPIEDWPEVLMHQFVIVGYREDSSPIYERFISRKDPNLDGPNGYDPLIDRFGLKPTRRCIAIAVELDPEFRTEGKRKIIDGFTVSERQFENSEGATVTVPNVALVIESPYTLYGHLDTMADLGPIEDTVFGIAVSGKGTKREFTVIPTNFEALDLDDVLEDFWKEFDLDEYLEELANEDRMHELIDHLPDDFVVSKYANKGKKEEDTKAGRSTRTQKAKDEEEEVDKEASNVRTRRFSDLKNKAQAQK